MTLEEVVREELALMREVIAMGRGSWPDRNYVYDDIWIKRLTQELIFENLPKKAGLNVN